jgi:hypothetical protein
MPRGAEVSPPCSPLSPLLTGSRGPRRGGGHVLWQSGVLCTLRATARHRDSVGRQRLNCLAGSSAAESLRIHRGEMEIETLQPSHEYKSPRPPGAALNATALFRPYAEAGIRPSASDAVAVPFFTNLVAPAAPAKGKTRLFSTTHRHLPSLHRTHLLHHLCPQPVRTSPSSTPTTPTTLNCRYCRELTLTLNRRSDPETHLSTSKSHTLSNPSPWKRKVSGSPPARAPVASQSSACAPFISMNSADIALRSRGSRH